MPKPGKIQTQMPVPSVGITTTAFMGVSSGWWGAPGRQAALTLPKTESACAQMQHPLSLPTSNEGLQQFRRTVFLRQKEGT